MVIATGDQSVLPLANDMAISLVGAELLKKNPAEQSEILSTWNIDDSAGMQFKAAIVSVISQRLKVHFAILLSSQRVNEITSTIEYIPRPPVPSRDLNQKVSEIENISPITQSQDKNALLEAFKRSVITIYFMDTTSEIKLVMLNQLEETFSLACSYIEDIANLLESDELSRNMQIAIARFNEQKQALLGSSNITEFEENYLLFSEAFDCCKQLQLEQLEQQILSFPEDTENSFRNEAIQQLKALELQDISGRVGKSTEQIGEIVEALKNKYEDFLKLDQLSRSLLDLRNSYSGSSETRKAAVNQIESAVNASYQNFATGRDSADECYKTLMWTVAKIKSCVEDDHKKHGAGRFFKSLQPESTLVKAIQSKINLKK